MYDKGLKQSLFTDPQENEEGRKDVYNGSLIAVSLKLKSDLSVDFQLIKIWKPLSYDYRLKWQPLSKSGVSGSHPLCLTGIRLTVEADTPYLSVRAKALRTTQDKPSTSTE